MYSHLVCSYIGSCKNLIVKYKAKRKRKRQGNCSSIRYLVFKVVLFFFPTVSLLASFWIAVPWPQQLSVKLTIFLLLNNAINLLFFSEHKLYGFPQSVLTNFAKFTGKHLRQGLFLNKVESLRLSTLFKKRPWHKCFSVKYAKFLRTPFLTNHLRWLRLNYFKEYQSMAFKVYF